MVQSKENFKRKKMIAKKDIVDEKNKFIFKICRNKFNLEENGSL